MSRRWEDRESFLVYEAERDLRAGTAARPCMLAFRGEQALFCAFLRLQYEGEDTWHGPVLEATVLASGIGADRVALSYSGRVTSLDDPIPPVAAGIDLRQRIVGIEEIDGHRRRARARSIVRPYDLVDGEVHWGQRVELEESQGWITQLIVTAVRMRHRLVAPREDVREQAALCALRGHTIGYDPYVVERFRLDQEVASASRN